MLSQGGLGFWFSVYASLVVAAVFIIVLRFLGARFAVGCVTALAAWLVFAFVIGRSGVAADYSTVPPGIVILLAPVFTLVLGAGLSPAGRTLASSIPLTLLVAFQVFRVGVEFTLTELTEMGLAPHLLTLAGGNFEILIAVSAPLVAWAATRPGWGPWVLAWNVLGLASLVNVASRAVLTAPGPLHQISADVLDVAIITYPFTFIPSVMAPLAVLVHILAIRSIVAKPGMAGLSPMSRNPDR